MWTGKGLFTGIMSLRVIPQFAGQVELLVAHLTFVALLGAMPPYVHLVVLPEFEVLSTDLASKGFGVCMGEFVCF